MGRRKRAFIISTFICPDCGKSVPLPRIYGRQKEHGHIKNIYCPFCKESKQFMEIRPHENYKNMAGEVIFA